MPAPIVCTLTPDQFRERKASLLPGLVARATTITPIDNGYRLVFAGDDSQVVSLIAACVEAERHCCRFLNFALTVPAEAGPIEFAVTGPSGTRAFLDALLT